LYWLSVGAQPTDPVKRLLGNLGTLDRFARLKEGADLEELLAEAEAAYERNGAVVQSDAEAVADEAEAEALTETEPEDALEEAPADSDLEEEVK
jgi:small subunit ribosomal protein S16